MRRLLALALLAALPLAACGGDAAAPEATPTAATATAPPPSPTAEATSPLAPTAEPTAAPTSTVAPTTAPTVAPTPDPTPPPTPEPTLAPTPKPTPEPTLAPTPKPTPEPTPPPTPEPTPPAPPEATSTAEPEALPTASTGALPTERLPIAEFVRDGAAIASLPIEAPPQSEYPIGLSGRRELAGRGMLFRYEGSRSCTFWMKNTWIDLDIAFAGADSVLFGIHRMTVEDDPANPQRILRSERDCMYAIEAPAGWFGAHGVAVGDRLRLLPAPPSE